MCAAMVERDPGLNRFNDDHYYNQGGQQNMSYNQDYQQGLQIGNYKDRRRVLDYERHKEYNILLREKKDQEARRLDELYGRRTHVPEKPELFDYKKQQQHNYEEKKKEYQEFLKKKEAESHMKKPPSPPSVGLDIGKHDMMRKQRQQAMQELYKSQLDEQQKEQMLSKAQHEIEVPRFNASPQKTSSQPLESSRPPPQDYDRMPPQEYNRRSRDGPMSSMEQQISNDHAYEDRKQQLMREIGADKEARDRQYREMIDRDRDARDIHAQEFHRHDEQLRDKNIMEYLEKKRIEEERQFNHPRKKKLGSDSYGQMDESYDPGRYEEMRHRLQDETHQEYKKELAKGPTNDIKYGLPIGQWRYDQQIKQRQMERNKEYNEFLKAQTSSFLDTLILSLGTLIARYILPVRLHFTFDFAYF
ncbi:hypothetical protein KUTeg_015999 [Tegillarca granosa]|uniref:Uncharacterized protein n=1 Tax=Tegillarca granosa TaxID=220873 RepID=A0ABQ9EJL6_TEGGR|nr:hypothetical protein KUTeg_015999 [Tegillarca granosa]